jgi:pimeloyl-ACP methyl ester carboxylesterase
MSGRAGVAIGITLALAIFIGWMCVRGSAIKKELTKKYPPPGQPVDMGGYHMHIYCQGNKSDVDSPTVIMEAAEFSLSWDSVQSEVATFARVCTYDRAGLGWSERSPNPRTAKNIVQELHTLLERSEIEPPYVLVGHSKGGMYVRLYAHYYQDEVSGMVLVDSAHEEQELRFPERITAFNQKGRKQTISMLRVIKPLNSSGFLTPILKGNADLLLGTIPERVREMGLAVVLLDRFLDIVIEETRSLEENYAALRAAQISTLGEIPLIVLTAPDQFAGLEGNVSSEEIAQLQDVVLEMQTELSTLSPNGKLMLVKGSGHHIQVDQPGVVIDAIREVVEILR